MFSLLMVAIVYIDGINIGINKDTNNTIEDYCIGLEKLGPLAHYITINI